MTTPEERYKRLRTTAVWAWAAIGILVLLAVALWLLMRVSSALTPFVVAFVIAFLLNWPVRALAARGMERGTAALICILTGLVVVGVTITLLTPPVTRQIVAAGSSAPDALVKLEDIATQAQSRFNSFSQSGPTALIRTATTQMTEAAGRMGTYVAGIAVNAGGGVAKGFFDLFIALVIAFWALKDLPKIREEILLISGPKYHDDVELLLTTVGEVVGGYLKGQTIASFATGLLAAIGLFAVGLPQYALVMGIVTFFFNFMPYIGPFMSGLIAAVLGLIGGAYSWTWIAAIVVIVVAQNFTDTVISPRVMSEQVDLHPILVILSLLVGASLFGIAGMLFAIPVAATGKGLFVYYYERRTNRQLSTEDGALFRGSESDVADCRPTEPDPPDGMCV